MSGNFADSNRASLRAMAEDPNAWGVTPATGASREMRFNSSKLAPKKETKTSDELRADRMIPNIIEVGASADGDVNFEFSGGAMDDFLAAFVYGLWSRPMTMDALKGINTSITANNTITIVGADYSGYFTVGRRIKTEGFEAQANNRYADISAVAFAAGATTITITGTPFTAEAASIFTKVADANDVIVLNNTAIRFGTAGAAAIDSNSGNAFAAAIAAGQIKVGQKIQVDGLGYDVGTIVLSGVPTVGDQVTIYDSVKQVTFQFGGVLLPGYINVAVGADSHVTGANLASAIRKAWVSGLINVTASSAVDAVPTSEDVTITNLEATGGNLTAPVNAGPVMVVTNFAGGDDSLRGVFTVTSIGNDVIGVSPAPATNANTGAAKINIKGSMLRNPSAVTDFVKQSFTVETSFDDVNQHFVGTGLRVGTFDLNVKAGEIVTGSIAFQGRAMERRPTQTSLLRNAPYTNLEATSNEVLNATVNVGDLSKNGTPLATALQAITLKGDASLREQRAVGNKYAVGIGVGRFKLTGSMIAYFESGEMFDDFVAHNTVAISWFFKDIEGNRYDFTLPAIKLTSDPVSPDGIDKDVMEDIEWEAQRDPATSCMIQIDRFSSVNAPTAI